MSLPEVTTKANSQWGKLRLYDPVSGNWLYLESSTTPPGDGLSFQPQVASEMLHPATSDQVVHQHMGQMGQTLRLSGLLHHYTSSTDNAMSMLLQLIYWHTHGTTLYMIDPISIQQTRVYGPTIATDVSLACRDDSTAATLSSATLTTGPPADLILIGYPVPFYALYVNLNQLGDSGAPFNYQFAKTYYTADDTFTALTMSGDADLLHLRSLTPGVLYWSETNFVVPLAEDYDNGYIPNITGLNCYWVKFTCSDATGANQTLKANELYVMRRVKITDLSYEIPVGRDPYYMSYSLSLTDV